MKKVMYFLIFAWCTLGAFISIYFNHVTFFTYLNLFLGGANFTIFIYVLTENE